MFEAERPRLVGIASRVLGDQDIVQPAWLRLHATDAEIDSLPTWLTTVTTRLCLGQGPRATQPPITTPMVRRRQWVKLQLGAHRSTSPLLGLDAFKTVPEHRQIRESDMRWIDAVPHGANVPVDRRLRKGVLRNLLNLVGDGGRQSR